MVLCCFNPDSHTNNQSFGITIYFDFNFNHRIKYISTETYSLHTSLPSRWYIDNLNVYIGIPPEYLLIRLGWYRYRYRFFADLRVLKTIIGIFISWCLNLLKYVPVSISRWGFSSTILHQTHGSVPNSDVNHAPSMNLGTRSKISGFLLMTNSWWRCSYERIGMISQFLSHSSEFQSSWM